MRGTAFSLSILGTLALVACGDGGSSPGTDTGEGTAAAFDQIADSIAGGGDFAHADALRHAAVIVRFTGDPTPVTLTIGGEDRAFVAVAEELEYPNFVCSAGADSGVAYPDSGGVPRDSMSVPPAPPTPVICQPQGSTRMRTLIAWEPQHMNEVVRLVADEGRGDVMPGVPDPMAGPSHVGEAWGGTGASTPTYLPPRPNDTTVASSPPVATGPGFMGEYLERGQGFWVSIAGTQANALEQDGGACRSEQVEFDWARYACQAIRVRFEFAMQVQQLKVMPMGGFPRDSLPPPPPPPLETRDIRMAGTSVAGARLSLLQWLPPPGPIGPPVPGPMPVPMPTDSGSAGSGSGYAGPGVTTSP